MRNLRAEMTRRELTAERVATLINMPVSTFYKKLQGRSEFTIPEAFATAYILMSYPAGVAFIVWLLIKLRYRFVWWHIFWLSFVITLIPVVGPLAIFIVLFIGTGKILLNVFNKKK